MKKKIFAILLATTIIASSFNISYASQNIKPKIDIDTLAVVSDYDKELKVSDFAKMFVITNTYNHGEDAVEVLLEKKYILKEDNVKESELIKTNEAIKILTRALESDKKITKEQKSEIAKGILEDSIKQNKILTVKDARTLIINYSNIKNKYFYYEDLEKFNVGDFFETPESLAYYLTKDGKTLVYLKTWEKRLNIFTRDIESGEEKQITKIKDRDMVNYYVKDNSIIYLKDFGGDENYHIFKADDNGNEVDLTPFEETRAFPFDMLEDGAVKDEILIQMNKDNKEVYSIYKLNIKTGELSKVLDNTAGYSGFVTDNYGKVRVATFTDGVNSGYLYRETEEEEFKLVKTYGFYESASVVMFGEDNKTGYALSNVGRNTTALVKFDIPTGTELEVVYQNDKVDITSVSSGKKKGTIGAVAYTTDKTSVVFFDKDYEKVYNAAKLALNTDETISMSKLYDDSKYVIVSIYSDTNRGMTYLYNISKDYLEKLTDNNILDSNQMADMIPVSYKSRDGFTIHGYLTLPKNKKAENLPVIINPHGGPWARDSWGFNPEVQLFANRGYAVLQMNFRGSTGYGKEFLEASYKQWGQNMQNDITDGVQWLIDIGVANPDKVGIYGGSYGGYATLAGVTFTPDLYAAAVDYVGVSNLTTFLDTMPPYWESMRTMMYEMVGDPAKDKEMLDKYSPSLHADKIKTPLFIAQGANDPRVKKSESDQMVEALKKNGIEVQYMVKDDEGHGFAKFENKVEFYTAMIDFFEKHLK